MEPRTLTQARTQISDGSLDPVELVEECLDLIDATDTDIRAWTQVDREAAISAAKNLDPGAGPLAGIPFAVKDIIDVAGFITTASSKALPATRASRDAPVARAVREAGAIILGKTNTHEFAFGYVSSPTSNPWDLGRIPGGSSGGSAAAVAAGHCLGALGTDTGGSIRVPAALCGVSGLLPSNGSLSLEGIIPLAPSLDNPGPIARDALDLMLLWEVLSGKPIEETDLPTIGIPNRASLPDLEPDVERAFYEAIEMLSQVTNSKEVVVPEFERFDMPRASIILPEALDAHRARGWWPQLQDRYSDEIRSYMQFAEEFMSPELIEAGRREARILSAELKKAVLETGVLVTPTAPCAAPTHETAAETEGDGPRRPIAMTLARLPGPVNMAGLAAVAIPCGFDSTGLPIGIQIIGSNESQLLELARLYQEKTDWHTRRPRLVTQ